MNQLEALQAAIKECGSIAELSRSINKSRPYIYKLLKRGEGLWPNENLCDWDTGRAIDRGTNSKVSWRDLCPFTSDLVDRINSK